jgi:diadenosine tetraphosphate (Ap4A) HIT family hydrolase
MSVNEDLEKFREKFMIERLIVLDDGEWTLSVRPGQLMLGSMVLSSTLGSVDFAGIATSSGSGFISMLERAEAVTRALYGAVRINVICLMMQDPVVHFHILPRYDRPVERYGLVWQDEDWPGPPVFRPLVTPGGIVQEIRNGIVDWFNQVDQRTVTNG